MRLLRIFFTTISILSIVVLNQSVFAKNDSKIKDSKIGGLKFQAKPAFTSERTSLSLFPGLKRINGNTTLSFDCKIYDNKIFGYIIRVIDYSNNHEKTALQLIYHHQDSINDSFTLELYSPVTHEKIDLQIAKSIQQLHIKLNYDINSRTVSMSCNGLEKSMSNVDLQGSNYNIIFGLWGQNYDVAAMQIRNIRIKEDKAEYFWPLNEFEGELANEMVSGTKSVVKNPIWLRKDHYYWQKIASFKADEMVGVIYKEEEQQLYFVNKDSLVIFDTGTTTLKSENYKNSRPFSKTQHFSIFNEVSNQIISYNFTFFNSADGKKAYSILNEENLEWSDRDDVKTFLDIDHHGIFWNPIDNNVITFGGYGHFEYHNAFSSFNFSKPGWESIEMQGDQIFPRTHSVIGIDKQTDLCYIYGGFGNEEGKQVFGGRTFYDLYEVNLKDREIKKLMDYEKEDLDFIPRGHLIIDNEGKDFYTLGSMMVDKSYLQLYHINPENKTIQSISDSIPALFTNMAGTAFLYKDDAAQELYCIVRENATKGSSLISVHRLKFPPSNLIKEGSIHQQSGIPTLFIILIVLISCTILVLFYFLRLRKQKVIVEDGVKPLEYSRGTQNAIWFLGGFKVFNPHGKDITYRFSKKLKELFILVYFETANSQGISSNDLSETLWPGMDKDHQKNNRGVTVNNLRKALEDLQGIKLINENNKWKIINEDVCYLDYNEVKTMLDKKDYLNNPSFLVSMFSLGKILPHLQFQWLDKFKIKYESEAIQLLYDISNKYYAEKSYLNSFDSAQIIHENFDDIDEMALALKIRALNKLKSGKKAHDEFELYKKRFASIYSTKYSRSFQDVENLTTNMEQ